MNEREAGCVRMRGAGDGVALRYTCAIVWAVIPPAPTPPVVFPADSGPEEHGHARREHCHSLVTQT